jgi:hypothetical protein
MLSSIPIAFQRVATAGLKKTGVIPRTEAGSDIDWWQAFLTAMGLQISRYSKANEIYPLADKWKKDHEIADPGQIYPPSKYRDLRNALQDNNTDNAIDEWNALVKETAQKSEALHKEEFTVIYEKTGIKVPLERRGIEEKLAAGFVHGLDKPFTGSNQNEIRFFNSLNATQKDEYKRALEERQIVLKHFYDMLVHVYDGSGKAHGFSRGSSQSKPKAQDTTFTIN